MLGNFHIRDREAATIIDSSGKPTCVNSRIWIPSLDSRFHDSIRAANCNRQLDSAPTSSGKFAGRGLKEDGFARRETATSIEKRVLAPKWVLELSSTTETNGTGKLEPGHLLLANVQEKQIVLN